ncbi:MAG: tetratricopeptide repeat protein [Pyrinomonadaceae bacterium]
MSLFKTLIILSSILLLTAGVASAQTPTTADGWNKLGYDQLKQKQYDAAIRSFDECIRLNANAGVCLRGRGAAHFLLENYDAAITDTTRAIASNPKDALSYGVRADAYFRLKKHTQAIADYSSAIGIDPRDQFYFARGGVYLITRDDQAAIKDFTQTIALNPNHAGAYDKRGDAYRNLRKYAEAVNDYTKLIELDPQSVRAHVDRGLAFEKLDKFPEAINDYTKAVALDPKYAWAYNNRGYIYERQNKYAEAIKDYTTAIGIEPKTAMFYRNRGNAFYEQEKFDEATKDLTKAIEIDPKFVWAYNNLGNVLHKQKKYAEAIAKFEKALEIDPKYVAPHYNIGINYRDQKNYQKAIENFSQAIELDDKYVNAYKERGDALTKLGKMDEALRDYVKLVELEPNNADRYVDRGAAYDRLKQTDKAFADYQKAIELNPKQYVAHYNLGAYYYNRKDYAQSLVSLNKAIELNSKYGGAYRARAIIYCKQNKMDLATADEKKSAEYGAAVSSPCAEKSKPTAKTDYQLAKDDLAAKRYAEAEAKAEKIFDSTLPAATKASQVFEIAKALAEAKQNESAKKLLEKLPSLEGITDYYETNAIYLLGNIYFIEKNYAKAHEYYDRIPGSYDARVNKIKVYYQENKHKEAAQLVAATIEVLAQKFYSAATQTEKQKWLDVTNNFMRDAFGLAEEYSKKPERRADALVIYKSIKKVVPAVSPDGKLAASKIQELEGEPGN